MKKVIKDIAEIYPCIQGEGSRAGSPSILIRTLGCNLRCHWCDTPYTSWEVEKGSYSLDHVSSLLSEHSQIQDIIVTGGEPCIYPDIDTLISICKKENKHITLETNGTRLISKDTMKLIDLVSISPKLHNSTPLNSPWTERHEKERIHIDILSDWMRLAKNYQLKFVVTHPEDLKEINSLIAQLDSDKQKVYLMPEGTTQNQLQEKREWLANICIQEGFCYCERLHVVIYGDKRGV